MTHRHIALLFSQTYGETWPGFHQYIYKTPNSVYGSSGCSQVNHTNESTAAPFIPLLVPPSPSLCLCSLSASLLFPPPCLPASSWHPRSSRSHSVQGCRLHPDRGRGTGSRGCQGRRTFSRRGGERSKG